MYIAVFLCREEGSNTSAKWSESPSKGSSLHIKRLRIVLNDAQLNVSNVKMIIEPGLPPDHQQESTPGLKAHVHNYQAVCNNYIIISGVLVVLRKQNTQIALSIVCQFRVAFVPANKLINKGFPFWNNLCKGSHPAQKARKDPEMFGDKFV